MGVSVGASSGASVGGTLVEVSMCSGEDEELNLQPHNQDSARGCYLGRLKEAALRAARLIEQPRSTLQAIARDRQQTHEHRPTSELVSTQTHPAQVQNSVCVVQCSLIINNK